MAQMSNRDKPTYYNIVILGNRVIAYNVPASKVHKVMKELAYTYSQKMEAKLVEEAAN